MSIDTAVQSRIIHIVPSIADEAAGPSYSVPRLCQALAEGGQNVMLMTVGATREETYNSYQMKRFQQDYVDVPFLSKLRFSRAMNAQLRLHAKGSAVLHAHGLWLMPNVYPGWAAKRSGVPLVVAFRGMLGPGALQFSRRQKMLMWQVLQGSAVRAADCFHATSDQEYRDIRQFGLQQAVAVVPNGIDVPPTQGRRPDQSAVRTVLYLGRIHPKKGIDRLIAAWHRIEDRWPDWVLRIIGPDEGGYLDRLKRQSTELGVHRVSFEQPLFGDAKYQAYQAADLFVLPTLDENFAMTVAEALAQGTPVICTRGAPWQGLETNRCGWWIEHGIELLSNTLGDAMSRSPEELGAMGTRGRDWMIRDFSWKSIGQKMSEVYRWVSAGGPVPDCIRTT